MTLASSVGRSETYPAGSVQEQIESHVEIMQIDRTKQLKTAFGAGSQAHF